jgi:hypothetical protein
MPRQAAPSDNHLKRIASDADHWQNWLERLAELRRATEDDEAHHTAGTKAMERLLSAAEATPPSAR